MGVLFLMGNGVEAGSWVTEWKRKLSLNSSVKRGTYPMVVVPIRLGT